MAVDENSSKTISYKLKIHHLVVTARATSPQDWWSQSFV